MHGIHMRQSRAAGAATDRAACALLCVCAAISDRLISNPFNFPAHIVNDVAGFQVVGEDVPRDESRRCRRNAPTASDTGMVASVANRSAERPEKSVVVKYSIVSSIVRRHSRVNLWKMRSQTVRHRLPLLDLVDHAQATAHPTVHTTTPRR